FVGTEGAYGEELGLTKDWAARIIRHVGNYGEVYERNVGTGSDLGIPRGLNELWNGGGILYAPPRRLSLPLGSHPPGTPGVVRLAPRSGRSSLTSAWPRGAATQGPLPVPAAVSAPGGPAIHQQLQSLVKIVRCI